MGMDIILNQRIYFPVHTSNGALAVTITDKNSSLPVMDPNKICSVSIRLGEFRGYEVAELLELHTGSGFVSNGTDWFFGQHDAQHLIETISEILSNPGDSSFTPEDREEAEFFLETIQTLRRVLVEAIDNGADTFEVLTWC